MNLAQMKADAEAAAKLDHNEFQEWYTASNLENEGCHFPKNARHLANCSPENLLRLLAVVEAARGVTNQLTDTAYKSQQATDRLLDAFELLEQP